LDKEIPLLSNMFPNFSNLTDFGKANDKSGVQLHEIAQIPIKHFAPFKVMILDSNST
jgi:hypothetical protein